jgi:hypothetical protein
MSDAQAGDDDLRPTIAQITVFKKSAGPLTKSIHLVDGRISNDSSACSMAAGAARRVKIDLSAIAGLAELVNGLGAREAYSIGRIKDGLPDRVKIVRADKLAEAKGDPSVIARTKDHLIFAAGAPAICLLDIDVRGVNEDARRRIAERGVWAALCDVIPALAGAARVIRRSTSTGLRNKDTGAIYPGSGGFHCAIAVADGADIPRFLADLHDRWAGAWSRPPDRFSSARSSTDRSDRRND